MIERAGKLKEEARPLFGACNNILEKMKLVDTIQHLGIDHMFEEEIDFALHEIQENGFTGSSLYEVALRFCLLREHSLWVSPDVFNKFKGEDGMFRNDIANDTRGLLSLYNAAYLLIPGEDELDEAISFARWNEDASYLLPEYLRKFYIRLLSNFKEMEEELPEDAKYRFARTKRELGTNKTDVASVVEWYFHENKVTSDIALAKIESIVEEQWKIINKARFGNPVLFPVMKLAIKIAVGIFFFNQDRCDHFMFNTEQLRETMLNLYVNPIPI
ncbi:hypothetical protein PR202_ga25151 [Eleusine coracana subsp. coracana]|uniref:Terpene synthase N-terminal domain-containing protein n=1 Tax=Eleusine coracana subsp. coracana TaxID=191504 RepID=A0AAV5D9G2_ELECO|nr:hypothetical protein PR202_ga25151 [Eleusine coracana subsp. coracana]